MEYTDLFDSGKVSKICYGTLSLSKLQNNNSIEYNTELLNYAFSKGINFYDTAELYDNYKLIGNFIKSKPREKLFLCSKSYAYDKKTADYSIEKALLEMNTDYIDVFMLHEQDSGNNFLGHYEAVERFLEYKSKGIIKHFGISTHKIKAVRDSIKYKEIEIIFPIVNINGIGISDGNIDQMINNITIAKNYNKFILSMKPFGGGHLITKSCEAFDFVKNIDAIDSIAVGMRTKEEIDANILYLENKEVPVQISEKLKTQNRKLLISDWCKGCGKCVDKCKQNALSIINNKCQVDMDKCVLCSYCADVCDEFCIKII